MGHPRPLNENQHLIEEKTSVTKMRRLAIPLENSFEHQVFGMYEINTEVMLWRHTVQVCLKTCFLSSKLQCTIF